MHAATGVSPDDAISSVIGVDARGCITFGARVMVAPVGSALSDNGEVTIAGKTYSLGDTATFSGGSTVKDPPFDCGAGARYIWVD